MFDYMRQRDKANMRGSLKTLADILNSHSLYYNNAIEMTSAHMKVIDIKHASEQDIEHFRSLAQSNLKKKGLVEVRDGMESASTRFSTTSKTASSPPTSTHSRCSSNPCSLRTSSPQSSRTPP